MAYKLKEILRIINRMRLHNFIEIGQLVLNKFEVKKSLRHPWDMTSRSQHLLDRFVADREYSFCVCFPTYLIEKNFFNYKFFFSLKIFYTNIFDIIFFVSLAVYWP